MEAYKREFIEFLQSAGVLKFGDFTAKSGRKIPYFINAGDIKTGDQISKLGEFYAKAYLDKVGNKRTALFGPAYKGISIAVSKSFTIFKFSTSFSHIFSKDAPSSFSNFIHTRSKNVCIFPSFLSWYSLQISGIGIWEYSISFNKYF